MFMSHTWSGDHLRNLEGFMVNRNTQLDINVPIKYGALFKIIYDSI